MAIIKEKDQYISVTKKNGKEIRVRFQPVIESEDELDDLRRLYVDTIKKRISSGKEKDITEKQILELEESWFEEA
jgi:hypothetical protein